MVALKSSRNEKLSDFLGDKRMTLFGRVISVRQQRNQVTVVFHIVSELHECVRKSDVVFFGKCRYLVDEIPPLLVDDQWFVLEGSENNLYSLAALGGEFVG